MLLKSWYSFGIIGRINGIVNTYVQSTNFVWTIMGKDIVAATVA